ncbi:MAG TPA: PilZ domain-containing protein [Spirochaetota bacterium]
MRIQEKRNRERIRMNKLTVALLNKKSGARANAEVINISLGGMCFLRTSMFADNDLLEITFRLLGNDVIVYGEVLRIAGREVGIGFTSSESDINNLFLELNKEYPELKIGSRIPLVGVIGDSDDGGVDKLLSLDDDDF